MTKHACILSANYHGEYLNIWKDDEGLLEYKSTSSCILLQLLTEESSILRAYSVPNMQFCWPIMTNQGQ